MLDGRVCIVDGMTRTEPPIETLIRLIEIASTHIMRDSSGVAWRIGGYCERGLNLVSDKRSINVQTLDGFTVERMCESPHAKNESQTDLRVAGETQRSDV